MEGQRGPMTQYSLGGLILQRETEGGDGERERELPRSLRRAVFGGAASALVTCMCACKLVSLSEQEVVIVQVVLVILGCIMLARFR